MTVKYLPFVINLEESLENGITPVLIQGWEEGDFLLGYEVRDGRVYGVVERGSEIDMFTDDDEDDELLYTPDVLTEFK